MVSADIYIIEGMSQGIYRTKLKRKEMEIHRVRLTQIDGKMPNLALMKLSHYFKSQGNEVYFERSIQKHLFEPEYNQVFGSAIFSSSKKKIDIFKANFPYAIVGGTGTSDFTTVEELIGVGEYEHYDYEIYPRFKHSIGFSQRGCRLRCKFCIVPKKEGKVQSLNSIESIWRGEPHPKNVILLDNDFFGSPDWKAKAEEIITGNFKVCFSQGINVRLISAEGAKSLAKIKYYDSKFQTRRIYTAWDNKKDEKIFWKGINRLLDAGIKPRHILVYMLCGYWKNEDFWEDVYYRFERMKEAGLLPYPMVYGKNRFLKKFQTWVIRRYHQFTEFQDFLNYTELVYEQRKRSKYNLNLFENAKSISSI